MLRLCLLLSVLRVLLGWSALLSELPDGCLTKEHCEGARRAMAAALPVIGLSERGTSHLLQRGRRRYSVCCAVDLLLNAEGPPAVGTTRCPTCGKTIRLRTRDGAIESVSPAGAIVNSQEVVTADGGREVCCAGSGIFDSERCLTVWLASSPEARGVVQSVEEYTTRCCRDDFRSGNPGPPPTPSR